MYVCSLHYILYTQSKLLKYVSGWCLIVTNRGYDNQFSDVLLKYHIGHSRMISCQVTLFCWQVYQFLHWTSYPLYAKHSTRELQLPNCIHVKAPDMSGRVPISHTKKGDFPTWSNLPLGKANLQISNVSSRWKSRYPMFWKVCLFWSHCSTQLLTQAEAKIGRTLVSNVNCTLQALL